MFKMFSCCSLERILFCTAGVLFCTQIYWSMYPKTYSGVFFVLFFCIRTALWDGYMQFQFLGDLWVQHFIVPPFLPVHCKDLIFSKLKFCWYFSPSTFSSSFSSVFFFFFTASRCTMLIFVLIKLVSQTLCWYSGQSLRKISQLIQKAIKVISPPLGKGYRFTMVD